MLLIWTFVIGISNHLILEVFSQNLNEDLKFTEKSDFLFSEKGNFELLNNFSQSKNKLSFHFALYLEDNAENKNEISMDGDFKLNNYTEHDGVWIGHLNDYTTLKISQTRYRKSDDAKEFKFVWNVIPRSKSQVKSSNTKQVCFNFRPNWFATHLHKDNNHWPIKFNKGSEIFKKLTEPIVEHIFLHTDGFALILDDMRYWEMDILTDDAKTKLMCFTNHLEVDKIFIPLNDYHLHQYHTIKFSILISKNIKTVHQSLIRDFGYIRRPQTAPPQSMISHPFLSGYSIGCVRTRIPDQNDWQIKLKNFADNYTSFGFEQGINLVFDQLTRWQSNNYDFNFNFNSLKELTKLHNLKFQILVSFKACFLEDSKCEKLLDLSNLGELDFFREKITKFQHANSFVNGLMLWSSDERPIPKLDIDEVGNKFPHFISTRLAQSCNAFTSSDICYSNFAYKSQSLPQFIPIKFAYDASESFGDIQWLITQVVSASMAGYAFLLPIPFMENTVVLPASPERYIRILQALTFMPALHLPDQPFHGNYLKIDIIEHIKNIIHKRKSIIVPILLRLTEKWIQLGEPIIRPMWYAAPDDPKSYEIINQYMLGDDIVVAPIVEPGLESRSVYLPEGKWIDDRNETHSGPGLVKQFNVPLSSFLPYFKRV